MFKAGSKATKSKLHEKIYIQREQERERTQTMVIVMYKSSLLFGKQKDINPLLQAQSRKQTKWNCVSNDILNLDCFKDHSYQTFCEPKITQQKHNSKWSPKMWQYKREMPTDKLSFKICTRSHEKKTWDVKCSLEHLNLNMQWMYIQAFILLVFIDNSNFTFVIFGEVHLTSISKKNHQFIPTPISCYL
jgi:hypothetical protein